MDKHFKCSPFEQVSHSCEEKWDISEIYHERMPYFEVESTFEGKEDMGDICSPRFKLDDQDLHLDDNLCDTPTHLKALSY